MSNQAQELVGTAVDDFIKQEGTVILDFWAPWCGPCKASLPTFVKFAESGKAKCGKVNVDVNMQNAAKFKVSQVPTFIRFENGVETKRLVGRWDEKAILN